MTVKEMHVDVRQQLQRLAANRNRKLADGQIDWALNVAQRMLLATAVVPRKDGSPRFEINREKREVVSRLLVSRRHLPAAYENDRYATLLPSDVEFLLDDSSKLQQLCAGAVKTDEYATATAVIIPFPPSKKTEPLYYQSLTITYNGVVIFNLQDLQAAEETGYTGMSQKEEHFYILSLLTDTLQRKNYSVFWEHWADIHAPNSLILVALNNDPAVIISMDGQSFAVTKEERTLILHNGSGRSVINPNTMLAADHVGSVRSTPYFKSSYISPVSELGPGIIYTYGDESFIVCETVVSYVRKPQQISLTLGSDCELSPTVHQDVCDLAVERLQQRIGDPRWQETAASNQVQKAQ